MPEEFEFTVAQVGQTFRDLRCQELPYRLEHTRQVDCLPDHDSEPLDRTLIAQAMVERLTLLAADRRVIQYAGECRTLDGITRNLSVLHKARYAEEVSEERQALRTMFL